MNGIEHGHAQVARLRRAEEPLASVCGIEARKYIFKITVKLLAVIGVQHMALLPRRHDGTGSAADSIDKYKLALRQLHGLKSFHAVLYASLQRKYGLKTWRAVAKQRHLVDEAIDAILDIIARCMQLLQQHLSFAARPVLRTGARQAAHLPVGRI